VSADPGAGGLAEALAPLYLAHLRRLDEMASRVAPEALLREATTRDDGGEVVLGPGGLPLRFDVADGKTGSTFEVRSARYDAPAVTSLRFGALEVALEPGCWEALPVRCRFARPPLEGDASALGSLLQSFAELGQHGAFAPGAAAPWSGRLHSVALEASGAEVAAIFDLGSAPPAALEVLLRALDGFGRERAHLAAVTIGGPVPDGPKRTR
jgi:hypothetical protein